MGIIDVTRTIVLAIKGYLNNDLGIRSAGLTYSTAFAIVPLLALIIAIAKGFGVEKLIQDFLESTFGFCGAVPTNDEKWAVYWCGNYHSDCLGYEPFYDR